jgi:hypothetical protein
MKYLAILAVLATTIVAAPTPTLPIWTPRMANYFDAVFKHIEDARTRPGPMQPPVCDLSKAQMPVAPTALPAPDGMALVHVAVGRGVQVCRTSTRAMVHSKATTSSKY